MKWNAIALDILNGSRVPKVFSFMHGGWMCGFVMQSVIILSILKAQEVNFCAFIQSVLIIQLESNYPDKCGENNFHELFSQIQYFLVWRIFIYKFNGPMSRVLFNPWLVTAQFLYFFFIWRSICIVICVQASCDFYDVFFFWLYISF